jgi:hypothetical protein
MIAPSISLQTFAAPIGLVRRGERKPQSATIKHAERGTEMEAARRRAERLMLLMISSTGVRV